MRRWLLAFLFVPALAAAQGDSLVHRLNAGIRLYERGDREAAERIFDRFIDVYNAGPTRLTSRELVAVAVACTYLGATNPQLYKDALTAYDRAIAVDPRNLDARVRLARLFLDKYNSADAKRTLDALLRIDPRYVPGLVAEARRRDFDNEPGADSILAIVLRAEPENVEAHVLRARLRADVEEFGAARAEIGRALGAGPDSANALAYAIALAVVTGDSAQAGALRERYSSLYPRDARPEVETAELLSRVRQYRLAADAARRGTQLDPQNWNAYAVLGLNLLRLGDVQGGRASLETAFGGDPYHIWVKNTLDLLDTFDGYDVVEHGDGRFRFMIEKPESELLALYLGDLLDSAYVAFSRRYDFRPSGPVRVEVYRSHADFSVRTVGLTGLGALGVSFGNTIAFDSPSARESAFNWGSTAWHELAHTFTLGASGMRVPRWLSEGLSVYEERRARPGWGMGVTPAFLQAYAAGKLLPASRLTDGFTRPAYPQQLQFSYYQASLVCEMIAGEYGEKALVDMLRAYRGGKSTEEVFRIVLQLDPATLDRRFDEYMRNRFGAVLSAIGPRGRYFGLVNAGRTLLRRGDTASAITMLERARAMFAEYSGPEGPVPLLVRARAATGDKRGAVALLSSMLEKGNTGGDAPEDAYVLLSTLQLELGDTAAAARALEGAMFVNPYDAVRHRQLAELYGRIGDHRGAVRERTAVVALHPVDRADALYRLAVAQRDAGDTKGARHNVLMALEQAPHFVQAQDLLLSLHGSEP